MDELNTLTIEALTELRDKTKAQFDEIIAAESPTVDQVKEAKKLAAELEAIDTENDARETEAAEAADELAALRERKFGEDRAKVDEDADKEGDEAKVDVEPETVEPVEPEAPEAAAPAAPEAIAASQRGTTRVPARSRVEELAAKTKRPATDGKQHSSGAGPVVITASAGIADLDVGQKINTFQVGEAILERARSFAVPNGDGESEDIRRFPTAKFSIDFPAEAMVDSMEENAEEAIKFATDQSRLPGGSLVAAGGWCAPSETVYDLDVDATTEGMLSLPEVGIRRGGMRWPVQPDFASFYANPGFKQTEAQAIAGTTKPCIEVPCPTFQDKRLDVEGLCIRVPILTQVGYPEQVANFSTQTMIAHQHWMNATYIGDIQAQAGTKRVITGLGATTSDTLEAFGLVIDERRQAHRLGLTAAMEVLLPFWMKNAFRADLARRNGRSTPQAVSDAEIQAHFASIHANVQWLYDWQGLTLGANVYPAAFQAIIYPAGTFVKGTSPVISLDTIYDAASLAVNTYTGLFTEQGYAIIKKKLGADYVEVPICNAGRMGALNETCVTP